MGTYIDRNCLRCYISSGGLLFHEVQKDKGSIEIPDKRRKRRWTNKDNGRDGNSEEQVCYFDR